MYNFQLSHICFSPFLQVVSMVTGTLTSAGLSPTGIARVPSPGGAVAPHVLK